MKEEYGKENAGSCNYRERFIHYALLWVGGQNGPSLSKHPKISPSKNEKCPCQNFFYLFFIYYGGQAVFFPTTFLMFIVFPFFFQGPSSYFISALSIPS